jgi:CBS domain-containing protein
MKVKEVMHTGVSWVEPDAKLTEVAKIMRSEDIGAVPVGEDDRLIGMITDRDIACRALANGKYPAKLTARDVMTKGIIYCRENEDVDDAIRIMESKQIRRLPVIDENKRMGGMLALGDISHGVSREMSGEVLQAVSAHHG